MSNIAGGGRVERRVVAAFGAAAGVGGFVAVGILVFGQVDDLMDVSKVEEA